MTACNKCKYHREMMFAHWCVSDEKKEVFDFITGEMVMESDFGKFFLSMPENPVWCGDKNKGNCPNFKAMEGVAR